MSTSSEKSKKFLEEIDARKAASEKRLPFKHEDEERLWKKLRLEWNFNSNHIEGNTLTYPETELMLIFDQAPNGTHTVREIEEMKAHDVAVAIIRDWAKDKTRELSEADIRDLNRILLVRPFWKEALTPDGQATRRLIAIGDYKGHPNSVRLSNGEMFHYASPEETPQRMAELIDWYRKASAVEHPLLVAARLHYDFVRIHPFDDGNGRVARLLMNYHLLRSGFPPVVIKSADKASYFAALHLADIGDFDAFAIYIGQQLLWSLELSIKAAKGESVEEMGDWEKDLAIEQRKVHEKEGVPPISNDLIFDRINDSIIPLYQYLSEKVIAKIIPFYAEFNDSINLKKPSISQRCNLSEFKTSVNNFNKQTQLGEFTEVEFTYYWQGFKANPTDSNDTGIHLTIKFNKFQYEIYLLGFSDKLLAKKYNEIIQPPEQQVIAENLGRFITDRIKRFTPKI